VKSKERISEPAVNVSAYVPVVKLKSRTFDSVLPLVWAVTVVAVAELLDMFTVGVPV
jgi:hypothetical protein